MMNILILTQKVDINDDVLGFFHSWLIRFAKNFDKVTVICLGKGKCELPDNVRVLSLGKEGGESKIKYIFRFYKYLWQCRGNYEAVFVHMNPVYLVLGGVFWRLGGKRIILWYNHPQGGLLDRAGALFAQSIFFMSPSSFFALREKARKMSGGIDAEAFKRKENISRDRSSILCLGRISPVKKIELLISAVKILDSQNIDFKIRIVGSPVNKEDFQYEANLKKQAEELVEKGKIIFLPGVGNPETPFFYNASWIFVNMTPTGSFDKTTLEAMSCACLALVSNRAFDGILPGSFIFKEGDAGDFAQKLSFLLAMPENVKLERGREFRQYVFDNHSLDRLVQKISEAFHYGKN